MTPTDSPALRDALIEACSLPDGTPLPDHAEPWGADVGLLRRAIAALDAVASPAERADAEWLPIESAPRDGRGLLLCDADDSSPYVGYRGEDFPDEAACDVFGTACYPKWWGPLPAPPALRATQQPNDGGEGCGG